MRTIASINEKILAREAVVWTVAQVKARVAEWGIRKIAETVDVVTTGTFEPMESSGAMINLGHTDPPIKIRKCWLNGVPAYPGLGAVDIFLGATMPEDLDENEGGDVGDSIRTQRGGGHVIADLIAGKSAQLHALGQGTDCYPRLSWDNSITKDQINQFYLYNPRNLYQNFIVGVNGGDRPLYTYLGPLQAHLGNAVYACAGAISPLMNDPDLELIGVGSKIFLGGGIGYIAWEGTQHFPLQKRMDNRTPLGPAATLALIGDAKQMDSQWVRGCYFTKYGPSLMLGVGVPLPVLHEEVILRCSVQDKEVVAPVMDFSIPRRIRPTFGLVSYAQLKTGKLTLDGKSVKVAPVTSLYLADRVAEILKQWITAGEFTLTEPVAPISSDRRFLSQDQWSQRL